ncbi:hypothetical protein KUTeg_000010 [Tegillarca granosa]|uniref:Ig-like domain-containing protein n=1 Tax=Tegillarca granosa TaxID=220873 RepID=A0ABQ9G220_TEGGR|nr:hypothetical protein KUTeg_000010 [Tegillarca granosa]
MNTRTLCQLCMFLVIFLDSVTDAVWTLTGSSEFAVAGKSFTLTCDPHDSNALAVKCKRLDIDTTAAGTSRATVEANGCRFDFGSDTQYQYTCVPGPVYKLTIPANVMTNSQNNKVWRCESLFGGAAAEHKVKVQVPVSSVSLQADNAVNQNVIVIYESIPNTFYCITNGCRPKANVTVTTSGVTEGPLTESTTQNGDLMITRVAQVIKAYRGGSTAKTIQCSAVNIQGRQSVASQLITFNVYYIPSVEPTLTGYTNGTVLYEGDNDLTVTCQQSGGYPLSIITWSCESQTGTTNNSQTVASSYVQLTVNRNLNRKTCTCTVRHPDNNLAYTRTLSVAFTVYYPPSTPTVQPSGTSFPWVENTRGVLRCTTTPGNPSETTYKWLQNSLVINGQTGNTFNILKLTSEHNGLPIQCRVSNVYTRDRPPAKVSNISTLDVQYKPIISLSNRMVVVAEGQDVKIICSAIGNPTPIVNWHRENLTYTFGTDTSATLALEKATRNDTGIYKCKANTRGNSGNQSQIFMSEESIKIYVFYFTINKATPVCSSSESISISCCSVINHLKPLKFHGWKHRMGNTTVRSLQGKLLTMNYNTLSIDYCGYYDSGIYTCEAAVDLHNNNTWYSFSSSIELVVTAPPVVSSNMLDTNVNKKKKNVCDLLLCTKTRHRGMD